MQLLDVQPQGVAPLVRAARQVRAADAGDRFNKQVIAHKFCAKCGIGPYALGTDPQGNAMAAINVRCLEGVDLGALKRAPFDGRSR
jgi:hypothetical protein